MLTGLIFRLYYLKESENYMYENAKLKLGKNETLYINIANPDGHNAHKLQHDESCCQHTCTHWAQRQAQHSEQI